MPETQSAIGVQFESPLSRWLRIEPLLGLAFGVSGGLLESAVLKIARLNVWACIWIVFRPARHESRCGTDLGFGFLLPSVDTHRRRLFSVRSNHGTVRNEARGCPRTLRRTRCLCALPWNARWPRIRYPRRIPHVHAGQEIRVGTCHRSWRISRHTRRSYLW